MNNRKVYILALATMLGVSAVGATVPVTKPLEAHAAVEYTYSAQQQKALKLLNDYRTKSGLKPVTLNPYLTKAVQNHTKFLSANGYGYAHSEKKGLKHYTGTTSSSRVKATGLKIGEYDSITEVIAPYGTPSEAVKSLIEDAYLHRMVLLDPGLTQVGISEGDDIVIDGILEGDYEDAEVMFPYNGMRNVPVAFYSAYEYPDPLRFFGVRSSGTIITYTIEDKYDLSDEISIKLYDPQGKLVPSYYRSDFLGTISTYPKKELKKGTKYTAKVKFYDNNSKKTISRSWSFTTEGKPTSSSSGKPASKKVLGNVTPSYCKTLVRYDKNGKRLATVKYGTSYNVVKKTSTRYYLSDGSYIKNSSDALLYEGVVYNKSSSMTVYNSKGKAVRKYAKGKKIKVYSYTTKRYNIGNGEYIKVSKTTKYLKNGKA